jgi:hypothetical protein
MRIVFPAALCLILSLPVFSDEPAEERDFGFQPLEIYEFDNGTSGLIAEDLNGDGLDDILFANNHVSRLEILIRKSDSEEVDGLPALEDRFENRGILVDQSIKSIRVADLNGDGLKDIATFGTTLGLMIRYQAESGSFHDPERIFIKDTDGVTTLEISDLNGDKKPDILVFRKDRADLHRNRDELPFQDIDSLALSADGSRGGDLADINNDGLTDLIFSSGSLGNPLRIRYGKGDGRFGTEQPLDLPPGAYTDLLQFSDSPVQIGTILRNRLAFRIYGFTEKKLPQLLEAQEVSPARIGLEGTSKKANPAWLTADFNSDGFEDLLIAAPELNRLHLYYGSATGLDPEPDRMDTLSEVSHISQKGNGDLLVISKKEKVAGIHAAGSLNTFPEILSVPGAVLAGCAIPGTDLCWLICKTHDGKLMLKRAPSTGDSASFELGMNNEPNDLLAFSLPDAQIGLLFFMPYDSPKMFLFDGSQLTELSSESFRALASPLIRSNIRLESPGDGRRLTVAGGSVARQFEWNKGRYKIVRQFNPENPAGKLIASARYSLLGEKQGTLLYDQSSGDLIWFDATEAAMGKIHIPDANQTIFDLIQLKNKERDNVILIDCTGFNEILGNGSRLTPVAEAEYVSPAEKPMLSYLRPVELGSPPRPMIALVDPVNRSIELVSRQGDKLKTELVFEVYLSSDFVNREQKRGTEPHDLRSADLNGDGIGDLVLLCQDKLLIYPGE